MGSKLSNSQIIMIEDEIEVECGRTLIYPELTENFEGNKGYDSKPLQRFQA